MTLDSKKNEREKKIEKYKNLLEYVEKSGDFNHLLETLRLIPEVIQESVQAEVTVLEAYLKKLESDIKELKTYVEKMATRIEDLSEKSAEQNRRLSHLELGIGALSEALLSRIFVEDLESQGYKIARKYRNYKVDNEDIDLLIIAEKDGKEEHFLVEVKVKPTHSDVGAILAKAELYAIRTGIKPKPVLAGVWIGIEVESYAISKDVLVLRI